jgi:hypothetical protein
VQQRERIEVLRPFKFMKYLNATVREIQEEKSAVAWKWENTEVLKAG